MSSEQKSFSELALLAREENRELALLGVDDCKELLGDDTALLTREETFELFREEAALLLGDETLELRAEEAHGQVSVKRKSGCSTPSIGSTEILMVCGPGLTSALPQFQTSGGLPKQ